MKKLGKQSICFTGVAAIVKYFYLKRYLKTGIAVCLLIIGGINGQTKIVEGKGDILWIENFENTQHDYSCFNGWRLRKADGTQVINVSRENGKALISNAVRKPLQTRMQRSIPLFPSRVSGDYIYAQLKVTEVSDKRIYLDLQASHTGIFTIQRPGTWTMPIIYIPKGVGNRDFMTIYLSGKPTSYVEVEWLRLACRMPLETVVWKRDNHQPWTNTFMDNDKITIMGNFGTQKIVPRLSFYQISLNRYVLLNGKAIEMRDDGKEGDKQAKDGIWSATISVSTIGIKLLNDVKARQKLAAKIDYGEEQIAYGFSPWVISTK